MQPQIALAVRPVGEPCMEWWTSLSPRLGSDSEFKFGDFFAWLRCQLIVIEDFPYARVDFWGSMDLVLPVGEDWDASGEKPKMILSSFFFILKTLYYFLGVHRRVFNRCIISSCR
jgi:hypothetical protein